jgi:S-adenosyl-L-methionine methyltransferase
MLNVHGFFGALVLSRLDSFIRRMQAQRAVLDHAAGLLDNAHGLVLELGLGNGRTYDHMRQVFPGRRIVAFDRANVANPASCPAVDDLMLGDIRSTGLMFARQHGRCASVVHADLGNGIADDDRILAAWLAPLAEALTMPNGLVLTSTELHAPRLEQRPLPPDVPPDRYFVYAAKV